VLARVLQGEFGRREAALRLELVGLRADARRQGAGREMLEALAQWGARRGIPELRTSAPWDNAQMLVWLKAMGFRLAPDIVLGLDVAHAPALQEPPVTLPHGSGPADAADFGAEAANDHERIARGSIDIRPMRTTDLPEILRIDRAVTGRDRGAYIEARLAEAMEDSAIRISLVGRLDGAIVCFLMARADLGDFGRTQPVAVLDTIGVDPAYAHRGLGRELVARLFGDVAQLQVRRVETLAKVADLALLGFFQRVGFAPAQRLVFVRKTQEEALESVLG
jgi:N-acetylglutamate synthase-like GNAT family acetyltransferase